MSNVHYADAVATKLRTIVAAIDQEILQVPPTPASRAAWNVGPAAKLRLDEWMAR